MKTLVTGAFDFADGERAALEELGLQISYHSDESQPVAETRQYEAVFCNTLFDFTPIRQFTSLRYIQLASAGYDRVDVEYAAAHGIVLYNARGVYSVPMAESAVCGVLQLYKQSRYFSDNQRQRLWRKHRGLLELLGKTVCILGCGSVGQECARRFAAFGTRVIGVDLRAPVCASFNAVYGPDQLDELLPACDVLLLTLPLTDETRNLVDARRIGLLKETAVVVNIARGAVIDQRALTDALAGGRLYGAVLDVFEEEPLPPESPLWGMDNVILTPHNSFVSEDVHERLFQLVISTFQDVLKNV